MGDSSGHDALLDHRGLHAEALRPVGRVGEVAAEDLVLDDGGVELRLVDHHSLGGGGGDHGGGEEEGLGEKEQLENEVLCAGRLKTVFIF